VGRASRPKPLRLAEKLKIIRENLGLSQTEMLIRLGYSSDKREFRSIISAYELGKREPTLIDLLNYAHLAGVTVESIIDDGLELSSII
jgi:transcriptional regulator with XRE-family HTH domain